MIIGDIAATFVVAILAGMGIGSGGLMVIYWTLIRGAEQLAAQGFNLMFFLFASCSSMVIHLLRRRIAWKGVTVMIISGLPAALLGTRLAVLLPTEYGRVLFGLFLIAISIPVMFSKENVQKRHKN